MLFFKHFLHFLPKNARITQLVLKGFTMKSKGEKLKELRSAYKLSQAEFADKVGSTKAAIHSYEHNFNQIPKTIMQKITQATGIGLEYFESNMSLEAAFATYNIDTTNPKMNGINESVCAVYNGLANFVNGIKTIQDFIFTSDILNNLFSIYESHNYHFITISTNEAEPFARAGEVLCVAKTATPKNAQIFIARIQQSVVLLEYFVLNDKEVILKGADGIARQMDNDEFSRLEILGVVKKIVSFR